jgi:hypothetical protein
MTTLEAALSMRGTLLLLPPLFILAGCVPTIETGPTRTENVSVPRDSSEFLRVNLHMGAGELNLSGGSAGFLDGNLRYNVESWKPAVKYASAAGHGNISIDQPSGNSIRTGNTVYEWNLRLPEKIPTDLAVRFGAGRAHMDLGSVFLRSVDLQMGVGEVEMDLRGAPTRSYDVHIRGGVGEVTVRLPRDVGVYASAKGGIGSIRTSGLRREGDRFVNEAYNSSKATIHLEVEGGIGQINLVSE